MTILDLNGIDRSKPYPCRECGEVAVVLDMAGASPAGKRFVGEHYPGGFYIPSCDCIERRMDERKREERQKIDKQGRRETVNYLMGFGGDCLTKTFASLDWEGSNAADVIAANNHRKNAEVWMPLGKSLALLGSPGSGKSVILSALYHSYISEETTACMIRPKTLFGRAKVLMKNKMDLDGALLKVKRAEILILDDVLDFEYSQWELSLLKDVLDFRYNTKRPTHFSSNLYAGTIEEIRAAMEQAFGEASIVDRLFCTKESREQAARGDQPRVEVRLMPYPSWR